MCVNEKAQRRYTISRGARSKQEKTIQRYVLCQGEGLVPGESKGAQPAWGPGAVSVHVSKKASWRAELKLRSEGGVARKAGGL